MLSVTVKFSRDRRHKDREMPGKDGFSSIENFMHLTKNGKLNSGNRSHGASELITKADNFARLLASK